VDGRRIYDLDPQSSELWAVAGPDDLDPATLDTDQLPTGVAWVTDEEREEAIDAGPRL
jgi:hypothetical protein